MIICDAIGGAIKVGDVVQNEEGALGKVVKLFGEENQYDGDWAEVKWLTGSERGKTVEVNLGYVTVVTPR